jgi:hypothetical protein
MWTSHLLLALAALPQAALTYVNPADRYQETVDRMLASALDTGEAYAMLERLCQAAPHRLSGSPGAAAAVEWARETMLAAGLENVRLEPVMVPHWVRGQVAELTLLGPDEAVGERLTLLALGGSVATPEGGIVADVIEVKSFDELAQLGDKARGKAIFFNRRMDPTKLSPFEAYGGAVNQRSMGAIEAAKAGGVAALVRSMTTRIDDFPHTGAMRYQEDVAKVPAVALSTLAAERLSALLARTGSARVRLKLDCKTLPDAPSFNVVGEVVGAEKPDEVVVIGGHLDCWDVGQGASDDGAGCVQSIEALRLVKALELKPRRTLRAVLFMNEENGLAGAKAYYQAHLEEMERHVLAIESDAGGFTPRGFDTTAGPDALEALRSIAKLLSKAGIAGVEKGGGGADIDPMKKSNVTLLGFRPDGQRYFDLHHSARDTLDQVSPRELELGAACIGALAFVVADLPDPLPRAPAPDR